MTIRAVALGALAGLLLASSTPAVAQAWIGQVVGEMAAQQAAAQREEACRKGTPADPSDVKSSNKRADKLMASFFALTSQSSKRDILSLFETDKAGMHVITDNGTIRPEALSELLDEPAAPKKLLSVVGGDNITVRVIWTAGEGDDTMYYGADITIGSWLTGAHILHLTVSENELDAPPAYCHLDPEQSF